MLTPITINILPLRLFVLIYLIHIYIYIFTQIYRQKKQYLLARKIKLPQRVPVQPIKRPIV